MANGNCAAASDQARVMALFKAGKSKAEIGREIGKTKERAGKLLAQATRGKPNA